MGATILLIAPRKAGKSPYILQPHLGLGYLAASLRDAGFEPAILDVALADLTPEAVAETARPYDLVGLTAYSCEFTAAAAIARALKADRPARPLIMGGPHFTALPAETMAAIPELTAGILGEGETALLRLAAALLDDPALPAAATLENLVWRDGETIRFNPRRFPDPAELPAMPAWDLLRPERYPLQPNGIFSREDRVAPIITGRGCPHACRFCASERLFGRRVRRRPAAQVVAEMHYLADRYGFREFHLQDSAMVVHGDYLRELCDSLQAAGRRYWLNLTSGVRLDTMTPELVRLLESAGCYSMALGIESGSDRVLGLMNKHLDTDTIRRQTRMIRDNSRIRLTGFFIVGYPGETTADIEATVRLSLELPIDRANFFNFLPLPGTRVFEELREQGALADLSTDRLYIHEFPFAHPSLELRDWKRRIRRANLRFYLRPRIIRGLLGEIRSFSQVKIILRRAASILC